MKADPRTRAALANPAVVSVLRPSRRMARSVAAVVASVAALAACSSGGAAQAPAAPGVMVNHGGTSQREVHVYLVWLGAAAQDRTVVAEVERHLGELADSAYVQGLRQYGVHNIRFMESAHHEVSSMDYTVMLARLLQNHPSWRADPNAQVILVLPPGVDNGVKGDAAFHTHATVLGRTLLWSAVDYPDDGTTAASLQSLITHEIVESATNTEGSGFTDAKGFEVGDPCNWKITPTDTGGTVQQFWDNKTGACWPTVPDGSAFVMHPSRTSHVALG